MKKTIYDYTTEEKYLIKELFTEGYPIHDIAKIINLSFQEVIYAIHKLFPNLDLTEYLPYVELEDNKLLIISDTHIGSVYENIEYLEEAFHYAEEHDIHTVLHGGDLIQSTYTNVARAYTDEYRQIEHLFKVYPEKSGFRNFILLGNHDYNTFSKAKTYRDLLTTRDDFEIMGYKRAYLKWRGSLIALMHSTKRYPLSMPNKTTDLNLKGHSHHLSYNHQNSIKIPTLSDDLLQQMEATPGFLIGTHSEDYISLESLVFKDSLQSEGKVLTKKLK